MSRWRAASRSRGEASPTLPSGAPTSTSRPALIGSLRSSDLKVGREYRNGAPRCTRRHAALAAYDRGVTSAATTDTGAEAAIGSGLG